MKKEDLKSTFGKIKPRDSLVDYTIARMHMEKEKQERGREGFFPSLRVNNGLKLAGAFCAIVLVVGLCIMALNNAFITPDNTSSFKTLSDTVKTRSSELDPATYSLFDDDGNGWILATGDFGECIYRPAPDEETETPGMIALMFSVTELHAYSNTLTVDIERSPADLVILADFGDYEYASEFLAEAVEAMTVRATPNDDGTWTLLDYSLVSTDEE